MCGFFQVIQKSKPIQQDRFMKALNSMKHRGPDASGYYFKELKEQNSSIFIGFGHQRLSILDLDPRSNQPFLDNEDVLLFNGEIYNFKDIRNAYKNNGVIFKTDGDTEVVMKCLAHNQTKDIELFNGMWAFSYYNSANNNIILSRDRYGKKPLFYYMDENIFCASSTIKALQIYLDLHINFEEKELLNYILYGDMWPTDNSSTHFKKIKQVIPGNHAFFDIKQWKIEQDKYFDCCAKEENLDFSEDALVEKLKNSVRLRLTSDRPVGLLLSGGIDSSLLLSILYSEGLHENIKIYMGDTGRSDDYKYAKQCVQKLGIKAETIVSDYGANTFDRFLKICAHHEKAFPFNGNAIAMSEMYEEISKDGVPVVLDGSGGDEIFGGYWQRHIPFALNDAQKHNDFEWMDMIKKYNPKKQEVINHNTYISNDVSLSGYLNPFLKIPFSVFKDTKSHDPLRNRDLSFNDVLCKDASPGGRLGEWIWHNDRNSMMYSVESRSPFLDCNLHGFIFSGYKNKFHENWNKYELRKVFDRFTPLPTQWRAEKQGFRWDGKHFFYNNKDQILEIIRKSDILKEYVHKDLFNFVANNFPRIFKSSIGRRFLGIAGIEYTINS
ncbi:MAG: asparagine synthase (glutamine-hydrolyzing) [Sulfurovaceae bacterium]|nr:asparagine synthase (glutamine-hydrolyzing) [Sulfurovaceae bacterium]MDD5548525.1 asparagine synthase (glutamine-hydrolyzing) [Sulfurovaceae bacterium]